MSAFQFLMSWEASGKKWIKTTSISAVQGAVCVCVRNNFVYQVWRIVKTLGFQAGARFSTMIKVELNHPDKWDKNKKDICVFRKQRRLFNYVCSKDDSSWCDFGTLSCQPPYIVELKSSSSSCRHSQWEKRSDVEIKHHERKCCTGRHKWMMVLNNLALVYDATLRTCTQSNFK